MTIRSRYTPGPWVIDRNPDQRVGTHIRASVPTVSGAIRGISVARITIGGGVADDVCGNARLIAAAPEMLDALRVALAHVTHEETSCASEATKDAMRGIAKDLRAAIDTAEGA